MRSAITFTWKLAAVLLLVSGTAQGQTRALSDREIAGLRGSVERCIQEDRYGQGDWHMVYETTYDPDGRISQHSYVNNDGSKGVQSFTYDVEGHLLRTVWTGQAGSVDTNYTYDPQGRLTGITGQGDWTTSIEYDDQGRKTRITKSKLGASDKDNHPTGFSIERENVDLFAPPPPGGWVTTSFNEHDQPIESQVYGPNGELISRLTRSYDAKGRVIESAGVIESFESLLPPATREQLKSDTNAFEKMQAELAEFLGDEKVLARTSYVYDDHGRVSEKHRSFGPSNNMSMKITYNDHGDEAEEIETTLDPPHPNEESVVIFSYQYDTFGNWTEKIASSPPTAKEPSKIWSIDHRTITYY